MQAHSPIYAQVPEAGVIVLDEEWQRQTEISERRKAQNRLAQRNFRKRRSQQQQQSKQHQEVAQGKGQSESKDSYPSPRPSPQANYRSVKSPDRESRGSISRERSGSISQFGSSSSSSGNSIPVKPQSMVSNDFIPLEEESMNPSGYHLGAMGQMGSHQLPGPYAGHYENGISPAILNQHMQFEASMYEPQYPIPYGNQIRPAIIPRTEGSALAGSTRANAAYRARKSSMSIDLGDTGMPNLGRQGYISPHTMLSPTSSHGLSPGLNSCPNGQMSLHLSAEKGHEGVVRLLLDCGADPNARDDYGSTPLHLAAKGGHITLVEALLDKGADVNAKNANGWSVVHIASKYGHENILRLLIQRGANVNVKANDDKPRTGSVSNKRR